MGSIESSNIFTWQEAYKVESVAAGGKGWNLGRLCRNGFKVPPGLVLSTDAYKVFISENQIYDLIQSVSSKISNIDIDSEEAENGLAEVRKRIVSGLIPRRIEEELFQRLTAIGVFNQPLAIRSSASAEDSKAASFAGIHSSYLNISGRENIIKAIKNCYASLWTPVAVSYRRKMEIDNDVAQAVVIMEMVKAEAAGVAFTCDPLSGRLDTIVINANYGLGEAVVSGLVEPDEYKLTRETFLPKIAAKRISIKQGYSVPDSNQGVTFIPLTGDTRNRQVISDEQILKLGLLVNRIFEDLGESEQHQDIEWVFDGKEFIIVQVRPVTSLVRNTYSELRDQPDIWSNANIKDSLPMVTSTLNQKLMREGVKTLLTSAALACRYPILPGLKLIRFYHGRGYFNLSVLQREYFAIWGLSPADTNKSLGGYQPEIKLGSHERRYTPKKVLNLMRLLSAIRKSAKKAERTFQEVRELTQKKLEINLEAITNEQIVSLIEEMYQENRGYFLIVGLFNIAAGWSLSILNETLNKRFPGRGQALTNALMLGQGKITSAEQGYRLLELAESAKNDRLAYEYFSEKPFDPLVWESKLQENSVFKKSLRSFVGEFGHRAVYELEIMNPRWQEDPSYLLNIIADLLDSPGYREMKAKQKLRNEQAWQEIKLKLSFVNRKVVKWMVEQAIKGSERREMGKSELVRLIFPMRKICLEIGRRFVDAQILPELNDVFYCTSSELASILRGDWEGRELRIIVEGRKEQQKQWEAMEAPDTMIDDSPQGSPAKAGISADGNLVGIGMGAAAGKASGIARLIKHPNEGQRLNAGEVLVAPATDPGWTPLFIKASAIIVENGGYLSHGAIVAREYGIPAVINIPGAMKKITDGTQVTVDGDEGKVYVVH